MNKKRLIVLAVLTVTCAAAYAADVQQEQWLRYRWSQDPSREVGRIRGKGLKLAEERPEGVAMPEFTDAEPLFAKWSSPLAKGGHLWLALERSSKDGDYDRLYIDSNGDGSLADETAVATREGPRKGLFGPVRVLLEGEDGPLTYHLSFRRVYRTRLWVTAGGWYEGDIKIDGTTFRCQLVDNNADGIFNDPGDVIRITSGKDATDHFVNKYAIAVEGTLYRLQPARDGACVKLETLEATETGVVRLPDGLRRMTLSGDLGPVDVITPGKSVELPTGQYRITSMELERSDAKGARWNLKTTGFKKDSIIDVRPGAETGVDVGDTIAGNVTDNARGSQHTFSPVLSGKQAGSAQLTKNGTLPDAPKLRIKNEDGSYDRVFNFSYG